MLNMIECKSCNHHLFLLLPPVYLHCYKAVDMFILVPSGRTKEDLTCLLGSRSAFHGSK